MIEVSRFEDVVRLKMGREIDGQVWYWVAAYLVDGLLVDTGCQYTADELAGYLKGKKLKVVVNTHYHEDHVGANNVLKERFGVPVFASAESVPLMKRVHKLYRYQEIMWGYPEPSAVDCLPGRMETDRFQFDVIDTPGHCPGHVVLVEGERGWCFSGDLYISRRPKVVRPEENVAQIVASMKRLISLRMDRLVLFTSLGNIVEDGREALQACVDYLRELSREAKELQAEGLGTGSIREHLLGEESELAGPTDGQFSGENLISAVLAADI